MSDPQPYPDQPAADQPPAPDQPVNAQEPAPPAPAPTSAPAATTTAPAVQAPVGSLGSHDPAPSDDRDPVTHTHPNLTYGAAGPTVEDLARLLAGAGYAHNSIVQGTNPANILDNSVMADVQRFCADHDVAEPQDLYQGRDVAAARLEGSWVGPYTWQALHDAQSTR